MRICLVLEGCYPYVFGGVSTWMHQYINQMQEHEFVLWVIGANAEKRGKFVYELPENVVEVHEVFLDDALQVKEKGKMSHIFSEKELESLSELMQMRRPDWETLFSLYHDKHLNPMAFLKSETFLELLIKICKEQYPYIAFADAFHTMRSMLLPVLYLMEVKCQRRMCIMPYVPGTVDFWPVWAVMCTKRMFFLQNMEFIHGKERRRSSVPSGWFHPLRNSGSLSFICCQI